MNRMNRIILLVFIPSILFILFILSKFLFPIMSTFQVASIYISSIFHRLLESFTQLADMEDKGILQ